MMILLQPFRAISSVVSCSNWSSSPRLMLRFEVLSEVVLGKDDGVFLLGGVERGVSYVQQIVAQRQMRAMLLQDPEREQAGALRARDGVLELGRGQFFPMDRRFALWGRRLRPHGRGAEYADGKQQ